MHPPNYDHRDDTASRSGRDARGPRQPRAVPGCGAFKIVDPWTPLSPLVGVWVVAGALREAIAGSAKAHELARALVITEALGHRIVDACEGNDGCGS